MIVKQRVTFSFIWYVSFFLFLMKFFKRMTVTGTRTLGTDVYAKNATLAGDYKDQLRNEKEGGTVDEQGLTGVRISRNTNPVEF